MHQYRNYTQTSTRKMGTNLEVKASSLGSRVTLRSYLEKTTLDMDDFFFLLLVRQDFTM